MYHGSSRPDEHVPVQSGMTGVARRLGEQAAVALSALFLVLIGVGTVLAAGRTGDPTGGGSSATVVAAAPSRPVDPAPPDGDERADGDLAGKAPDGPSGPSAGQLSVAALEAAPATSRDGAGLPGRSAATSAPSGTAAPRRPAGGALVTPRALDGPALGSVVVPAAVTPPPVAPQPVIPVPVIPVPVPAPLVPAPPVETPPVAAPPVPAPPVAAPPVETPPVEALPVEAPPVEAPATVEPPVETSGPVDTPSTVTEAVAGG